MAKKKQSWCVGDVFLAPNRDGLSTIGQVVAREKSALNSVSCAFFDVRVKDDVSIPPTLPEEKVFSVLFVTPDFLDHGIWRTVGNRPVTLCRSSFPYEHLRPRGWIGAKVIGTAIVREFLDAFYGLRAWDDWHDPQYLDRLLLSLDKKPHGRLVLKG